MADILLVEDKETLRRVLYLTLENAGYTVTEAADAKQALHQIAISRHRLVLTDLRMPNGSGLDVLRSARAADPDVPVVSFMRTQANLARNDAAFRFVIALEKAQNDSAKRRKIFYGE